MVMQVEGEIRHASDEEVDSFAAGRLEPAALEAFEEHVLVCSACLQRANEVFDLAHGLEQLQPRPRTARMALAPLAAAVLISALVGGFMGRRWAGTPIATVTDRPVSPGPAADGGDWQRWALHPTERAAGPQGFAARATGFIVLELDAAELLPERLRFEVRLTDARGATLARLTALEASARGLILVPLPAAVIPAGSYVAEVRRGDDVLSFPFLVRP